MQSAVNCGELVAELAGCPIPTGVIFADRKTVRVDPVGTSEEDGERWDGLS